ncbi:MAG TPA: TRAM domain-containing protein [Oligoflexia bacterium]|nr:TRAM domain-containing protein [Oligoflexia bacterium]HMP49376.1 TRAM domain-containing protein [Oligoflexia bacterium]
MSADVVSVHIRGIAVGGEAVGEVTEVHSGSGSDSDLLGITTFVPFANPGEIVLAQVTEKKDKYLRASLLEVVRSSPERVTPRCPYFTDCGGCELQQLSLEGQLSAKFQMIQGALRAGRLPANVVDMLSPVVPGLDYGFRRRIQLHISSSGSLGFYRAGTRSVVSINSCPVAVPEINTLIPSAKDILPKAKGLINSLTFESDGKKVIAILTSPYALSPKDIKEIESVARGVFKDFIIVCEGKEVLTHGQSYLDMPLNKAGTLHVSIPGGAFSQVNWPVNLLLIEKILEFAGTGAGKSVFDLFSGAGNFSLPLARAGFSVTAVETDKRLIVYGRDSARKSGLEERIQYVESSVEKYLKKHPEILNGEYVIADPPRSGLGASLVDFLSNPEKIFLVSCHLPSFVRDLKALSEKGFGVELIQPFDMFSQTSYVEILAVLEKNQT